MKGRRATLIAAADASATAAQVLVQAREKMGRSPLQALAFVGVGCAHELHALVLTVEATMLPEEEGLPGTVFDPESETFAPIMAAISRGDFEEAAAALLAIDPPEGAAG